jgi:hypothetical protein
LLLLKDKLENPAVQPGFLMPNVQKQRSSFDDSEVAPLEVLVYARKGRELMECKSPVRENRRGYVVCDVKVQSEGKGSP